MSQENCVKVVLRVSGNYCKKLKFQEINLLHPCGTKDPLCGRVPIVKALGSADFYPHLITKYLHSYSHMNVG